MMGGILEFGVEILFKFQCLFVGLQLSRATDAVDLFLYFWVCFPHVQYVSQGSSSFFLNTIYYSPRRNPETSKEFHPML